MIINFSLPIQQGRLGIIRDAIDSGSNGKCKFYSGTKPTSGASITDQVLLATIVLNDPCATITNNVLTFSFANNGETQCSASGQATWCRITNSADLFCIDMDVTDNNGSGTVKIDSTALYQGGTIRVQSGTFSEP